MPPLASTATHNVLLAHETLVRAAVSIFSACHAVLGPVGLVVVSARPACPSAMQNEVVGQVTATDRAPS